MKRFGLLIGFVILALIIPWVTATAHGGDVNLIHACVSGNGSIKILMNPSATCSKSETTLDWGIIGPIGPKGDQGDTGLQGIPGPAGTNGVDGADGIDGKDGVDGINGKDGVAGINGQDGANGTNGVDGAAGPAGPIGETGLQGPKGDPGEGGLPAIESLIGLPCRVGTLDEGTIHLSYDQMGEVTLTCGIAKPPQTLTVLLYDSYMGSVISQPMIICGATCSAQYPYGTQVTLVATAFPGYIFLGWGGACNGTGDCTVTMNAPISVTAEFRVDDTAPPGPENIEIVMKIFTPSYVWLDPDGFKQVLTPLAKVTGNLYDLSCSSNGLEGNKCFQTVFVGDVITFEAVPLDINTRFVSWSGDFCSGSVKPTCVVTVPGPGPYPPLLEATFEAIPPK